MEFGLGLIVFILLMIYVVHRFLKNSHTLTGIKSAQEMQELSATSLDTSENNVSNNFTYSIWIYVQNWNYRYGEPKVVFGRMTKGEGMGEPCPSITLAPIENNAIISLSVYPGLDEKPPHGENHIIHSTTIQDIPVQKWVNLAISVYNRTLDIYLDGKLTKTELLPGIAKVDGSAPVFVTPKGGFAGWTANMKYWANASNPEQIWDVYKSGYSNSWFGDLLNQFGIKISFVDGGVEKNSITI